jgi:hypothetical protein
MRILCMKASDSCKIQEIAPQLRQANLSDAIAALDKRIFLT